MGSIEASSLAPMVRGRLDKHLGAFTRYEGVTMTRGELYALPCFVAKARRTGGGERFTLVDTDGCMIDIPRMVFDAIRLPLDADLHQEG